MLRLLWRKAGHLRVWREMARPLGALGLLRWVGHPLRRITWICNLSLLEDKAVSPPQKHPIMINSITHLTSFRGRIIKRRPGRVVFRTRVRFESCSHPFSFTPIKSTVVSCQKHFSIEWRIQSSKEQDVVCRST